MRRCETTCQSPPLPFPSLSHHATQTNTSACSYAFLEPYYEIIKTQITTPVNGALLCTLVAVVAYRLFLAPSRVDVTLPKAPPAIVFRTFTPRILLKYDGTKEQPVYLAVKGKVYDVSPGRNFYGPGGPYENFSGRDATRGLACQSFDETMLTKDLDGPLDDCSDLDKDQIENLNSWVERFDEKVSRSCVEIGCVLTLVFQYLVVGKLVPFNATKSAWAM